MSTLEGCASCLALGREWVDVVQQDLMAMLTKALGDDDSMDIAWE